MEYIQLTQENLQKEHICCSMTEKKGDHSVTDKKAWLKERMEEGLVFYKADVRGKVFIEYIPAQAAWFPIQTDNWMHINCLWVSGSFKGCGYSDELLEHCIADAKAKGMHGLTILSGKKKLPYLSDPSYLKYKGFIPADEAGEYVLMHLPFHAGGEKPRFADGVLRPQHPENTVLYRSMSVCQSVCAQIRGMDEQLGTGLCCSSYNHTGSCPELSGTGERLCAVLWKYVSDK